MSWEQFIDSDTDPDTAPEGLTSFVPLDDYRLIIVSGEQSETFLQGQCTCDFTRLAKQEIILGAHCTHKGRMNSSFHAIGIDETTIALRVHNSISDYAKDALAKYAVFSKVTIEFGDEYYLLGILGKSASEFSSAHLSLPEVGKYLSTENYVIAQHQSDQIEVWCKQDTLKKILQSTESITLRKNSNLWRLTNVRRGIGEVQLANVEQLLPQELNFQLTDGISFQKGCYTGQEIVARLHYRGQMKKHLYRAKMESAVAPTVNDIITSADTEKHKGIIVNFARVSASEYELLILCDSSLRTTDSCVMQKNTDAKIQWMPLPYAIS